MKHYIYVAVVVATLILVIRASQAEEMDAAKKSVSTEQMDTKKSSVEHVYKSGETLWFIAVLYYGNGQLYSKIVEVNHLHGTEGLTEGQKLVIPKPKFTRDNGDFTERYARLMAKRTTARAKVLQEPTKVADQNQNRDQDVLVVPISPSPMFKAKNLAAPTAKVENSSDRTAESTGQ